MICNLNQLKKALAAGRDFEIVEHYIKPEMAGQIRAVNVLQTNGMYTHVVGGCAHDMKDKVNGWNEGRGSWIGFGKASDWKFCDGLCTQSRNGRTIWTVRVIEEGIPS